MIHSSDTIRPPRLPSSPPLQGAALQRGGGGPYAALRAAYVAPGAPPSALSPSRQGCLLTHVRACHRLLYEEAALAIFLEDEALVVPNFISRLLAVLRSLPAGWHVLYLNTCEARWGWREDERGMIASPLARHARRATCTVGMVLNDDGAGRVLTALRGRASLPLDLEYIRLIRAGLVRVGVHVALVYTCAHVCP